MNFTYNKLVRKGKRGNKHKPNNIDSKKKRLRQISKQSRKYNMLHR